MGILRAGHENKDIVEWFKYLKTMIHDLAKAWPERKTHMKHSGATRILGFVADVDTVVKETPEKS